MAVSYTHLDVYKRQVTFISLSYINIIKKTGLFIYGAPIASCAGFIILSGGLSENFNIVNFGAKGMFTAIFSSIASTYLYVILAKKIKIKKLYTQGADLNFNNSLSCLIPMAFIVLIFAAVNLFISKAFNVSGFQELFVNITNQLFIGMGRSLPSSLLFVFVSSFLWFFGIHGSDVLENVADSIFKPATEINQSLINAGAAPTEIYSKTYHDTFVLMEMCIRDRWKGQLIYKANQIKVLNFILHLILKKPLQWKWIWFCLLGICWELTMTKCYVRPVSYRHLDVYKRQYIHPWNVLK